jgi:hypothetical protein
MEAFSGDIMENAWIKGDLEAGFLLAGQMLWHNPVDGFST